MASQSDITISSLREHLRRASNAPLLPIARGIVGDLRRWPFFHSLPLAFAKTIRICSVFGEKGSEVLCVTADDEVWTLGANTYGRLGTGNTTPASTLIKIPELCGKAIQSFAHGAKHTLAVTKKGEVYGWGRNDNSQVGKADPVEIFTPTLVYNGEDPALEIACGHFHSACRTREGAVYCWGDNSRRQLGIGSDRMPQAIRKVERSIGNLKCIGISCGANSTVALFENGEVYSWGLNGTRQVTRDPEEDEDSEDDTDEEEEGGVYQDSPKKVDLGNTIICKIACGDWHTVALADDGALHVWGKNDRFQLGMDDTTDRTTPCLHSNLRDTYGVVLDIAACGSTSAVMTYESKVLMWGSGAEGVVKVPTAIPGDSVQDVFAAWTKVSVTPVPLVVAPFSTTDSETQEPNCAPGWEGNLANTVAENFNNPTCSDVKFAVGNETIHAHRAVLCFQSEYFRNMFEGAWKDSGDTIEVSEFRYPVYEAFLRYFYTGEVNLPATECLELLDLVKTCSDSVLGTKCQRRIKVMVSVENCASVYAAALRCGAEELEDFCFRFALDNLAAVKQTPAFKELPDHVSAIFRAAGAEHGVFNK